MLIKQLSVFLENRLGRFSQVANLLGQAGINMKAFTVSENAEFGILHIVVSNPQLAKEVLRKNNFSVSINEVICLQCPDTPGSLGKAMDIITKEGIFIEYMYAFAHGEYANVIIRPGDINRCVEVLHNNEIKTLNLSELNND